MFYKVKVIDPQGNVKKVISPKKLSDQFWMRHNQGVTNPFDVEDFANIRETEYNEPIKNPQVSLEDLED